MLLFCSVFMILPNLSTDESDYSYNEAVYKKYRITETAHTKGSRTKKEKTLFLVMEDGSEYEISEDYSKYWPALCTNENIGKAVKLYHGNGISASTNPAQIKINDNVIYGLEAMLGWNYFVLVMTVLFTVYTVYEMRKGKKEKADKVPVGADILSVPNMLKTSKFK